MASGNNYLPWFMIINTLARSPANLAASSALLSSPLLSSLYWRWRCHCHCRCHCHFHFHWHFHCSPRGSGHCACTARVRAHPPPARALTWPARGRRANRARVSASQPGRWLMRRRRRRRRSANKARILSPVNCQSNWFMGANLSWSASGGRAASISQRATLRVWGAGGATVALASLARSPGRRRRRRRWSIARAAGRLAGWAGRPLAVG